MAKSSNVDLTSKELLFHPCDQSPLIGRYISETHKADICIFNNYLSLVEMFLPVSNTTIALSCLVEIFGTCPELFANRYSEKIQWIMVHKFFFYFFFKTKQLELALLKFLFFLEFFE